jgi:hypothetical protein
MAKDPKQSTAIVKVVVVDADVLRHRRASAMLPHAERPRATVSRVLSLLVAAVVAATPDDSALDAAFVEFWAALNPKAAQRIAERIARLRPEFEEVQRRLAAGRPYGPGAPTGELHWTAGAAAGSPLLRWAARDNDRSMLVAAELRVDVPAGDAR